MPYVVVSATPHSGRYRPEHIMVDKPYEQSSRWSGAYPNGEKQWLLLKLETPGILSAYQHTPEEFGLMRG